MRMKRAEPFVVIPHTIFSGLFWAKLSLTAKAVYPVLLKFSNGNTNQCWPGTSVLVEESGVCRKSVFAAIKELVEKGAIGKELRFDDKGHNLSNLYTMYVPSDDEEEAPSALDALPPCIKCTTPSASDAPELDEYELDERTINTPTGSAVADAPAKAVKPDVYQAALAVYEIAGMPEPPSSEVRPLLGAMKAALASGWDVQRIGAAWCNARKFANVQVWGLAYTLRRLTEAEAMTAWRGGKLPELSSEERKAAARDAVKNAFGGALNDR